MVLSTGQCNGLMPLGNAFLGDEPVAERSDEDRLSGGPAFCFENNLNRRIPVED